MAYHDTLKKKQNDVQKRVNSKSTISKYNMNSIPQQMKVYRIKSEVNKSRPVPTNIRKDPFAEIPVLTLDDLNKGLYTLVNQGYLGKHVDITQALQRNKPLITAKKIEDNVVLFNDSILELNLTDNKMFATEPLSKPGSGDHSVTSYVTGDGQRNPTRDIFSETKATTKNFEQPLMTLPMINIDPHRKRSYVQYRTDRSKTEKAGELSKKEEVQFVSRINCKVIDVLNGDIKKDESYLKHRSLNLMTWGDIEEIIEKVVVFAINQRVMTFKIYLDKVKLLASLMRPPTQFDIIGCIQNYQKIKDFVSNCYTKVEQSSDNDILMIKVCTKIQKNFRKLVARRLVFKLADIQKKIKLIQFQIRLKHIHQETVKRTAEINAERYKIFLDINKKFIDNWDNICDQKRVEVHVNSLSRPMVIQTMIS